MFVYFTRAARETTGNYNRKCDVVRRKVAQQMKREKNLTFLLYTKKIRSSCHAEIRLINKEVVMGHV